MKLLLIPIEDVYIRPCRNCGNLKALVSLTYYGLVIRGIKILEGEEGLFIGMPARKRNDEWEDVCFFIDPMAREKVQKRIMEEYDKISTAN